MLKHTYIHLFCLRYFGLLVWKMLPSSGINWKYLLGMCRKQNIRPIFFCTPSTNSLSCLRASAATIVHCYCLSWTLVVNSLEAVCSFPFITSAINFCRRYIREYGTVCLDINNSSLLVAVVFCLQNRWIAIYWCPRIWVMYPLPGNGYFLPQIFRPFRQHATLLPPYTHSCTIK
jgi:hypothetical protein